MKLNNLFRLTEDQIKSASKVLAQALYDDPVYVYFFPDKSERKNKLPYLYEFLIRYSILYGEVYTTSPNLEGVVLWLPYWEGEMTLERQTRCGGRELISNVGMEFLKRYMTIDKCISSLHQKYACYSHWYLYIIGVNPAHQGKGFASTLLRAKFAEIDEQNLPCYLENFNEENVPIYQHFGFEVVEEGIIPKTDVPIWAMLRKIE